MNFNSNTLRTGSLPSLLTLRTLSASPSGSTRAFTAPPSSCSTDEGLSSVKVATESLMPREWPLPTQSTFSDLNSWRSGECVHSSPGFPCFVHKPVRLHMEFGTWRANLPISMLFMPKISFRQKLGAYWVLYKERMPGVHGLPKTLKEFCFSNNVVRFGVSYHMRMLRQKSIEELLEIVNMPSRDERPILEIDNVGFDVQNHTPIPKKIWMSRYALEHSES